VNSPTTHLNWSLFYFNISFVLLAEDHSISPFACLSPVMDSQGFLWFLFVQSLTALLATPIEMPQAGSGPTNRCSDSVLANWSAISLPTVPSWPGTHISWTLLCWPVVWGIGGSPWPVVRWSGVCHVLWLQLDSVIECTCFCFYSSYLGSPLRMP
jgi:hypothetical protein